VVEEGTGNERNRSSVDICIRNDLSLLVVDGGDVSVIGGVRGEETLDEDEFCDEDGERPGTMFSRRRGGSGGCVRVSRRRGAGYWW
jgi:hypothetical protein